ncbi:DMT family transporter [Nocardioides panacisoli]|uniref:DMT family transporter n=1 Tax=Nocardioides panacisoli TaxID=627624 RepID=UPI001C62FB92|nr:DMT family transporter [Nocardioides panacisoli]QYJ02707.1 DMT family transporter [Nocardioides panacisoli]
MTQTRPDARHDATPTRTAPVLPLVAAATTLVLWASAFVAIRHLGEDVGAGALSLGRLVVAAVVLGGLLALRAARGATLTRPGSRDWPLLLLCGVSWFGIYNISLNAAEQRIDAGTAALVIQVGPLVVAVLAAVFLAEPLHRWLVVGMAVGFAGVALIAQGSASAARLDGVGVALALLAALTYAIGVLSQKPLVARLAPLEITFLACVIGALVCLPWAGDLLAVVRDGSAATTWWIVYLGIFPTAVAFSTWAYALSHTDAGALALTTFLVPLIATVMAWLLLAEVPPVLSLVGGALAIVGVLLTRRRPRPARPQD